MPAPIDYLTPAERQAYDAVTRDAADADASAPARAIRDALTELARRRERDVEPALEPPPSSDRSRRDKIRALIDLELQTDPPTEDTAKALAYLSDALNSLSYAGSETETIPEAEHQAELAARERDHDAAFAEQGEALAQARARTRELAHAITNIRVELVDLGPSGRQLLAEGRLERLGAALELAVHHVAEPALTMDGERAAEPAA